MHPTSIIAMSRQMANDRELGLMCFSLGGVLSSLRKLVLFSFVCLLIVIMVITVRAHCYPLDTYDMCRN